MSRALPMACALLVVAALWALVAGMPLLSESYTQLALVGGFRGALDAFDPALVPFRPLQHLAFFVFDRAFAGAPAVGRAMTFGLHAASAMLVFAIATRLGASRRGAWTALLLFLAFPAAKGLTWVAAVSGPARTLGLLWIVWATIACAQRPSRRLAWAVAGVFVLALGFHQSAIIAPAIFLAGVFGSGAGDTRQRLGATWRAVATPPVAAMLLLAVGYVLYVGTLQARSYHGIVPPGAIAANVARASLALAPEWVRLPALDGLRDAENGFGFAGGALAVGGMLALLGVGLVRGGPTVRWLLLLVPLDLALPVLTTGFVGRYAHFAAAVTAIVLGLCFARTGPGAAGRWLRVAIVGVGLSWAVDHAVDLRELRDAGATAERLLAAAAAARAAAPPGAVIVLVDAPDHVGGEDDIPLFNWGLAEALARRGASGPWQLLRVDPCWTTSDHRAVTEEELARSVGGPGTVGLRYDPGRGNFAPWAPR